MASKNRSLATYRAKRDFATTAEPSGEANLAPSDRLRFVIQKHDATRLHYDLRLELGGIFKSWVVTKGPSLDPHDKRLAVEVEDHPLDYGDFEGKIPKGQYGGGTVLLWDRGYWAPEGRTTPEKALATGELKFTLDGAKLHGGFVLVRLKHDRHESKRTNWLLIKHRDDFAKPGDGESAIAKKKSVASGRVMEQVAAGKGRGPEPFMQATDDRMRPNAVWDSNSGVTAEARASRSGSHRKRAAPRGASIPAFIPPQLCDSVERPFAGAGWVHEIKFDGYRVQAAIVDGNAIIRTRNGLDWTSRFSAIADDLRILHDCILDGEIVALDHHGAPDFAALQAALSERKSADLVFFVFDLLFDRQTDIRDRPLSERKRRLLALIGPKQTGRIRYVEHFATSGDAVLKSACKLALEGIVSKKIHAPYVSGRSGAWTKAKCRAGHEVVIGGWATTSGRFRSLLVGVHRGEHFVYIGRVGTGFGEAKVRDLVKRLGAVEARTSPFTGVGAPKKDDGIHWTEPKLVAEIAFAGWTGDGCLRVHKRPCTHKPRPWGFEAIGPEPDLTLGERGGGGRGREGGGG